MGQDAARSALSRAMSDYGILGALVVLCLFFSWRTLDEQHPNGAAGAAHMAKRLEREFAEKPRGVLIVARDSDEDREFAEALAERLAASGTLIVGTVTGKPAEARRAIGEATRSGHTIDAIACNHATAAWPLFADLGSKFPALADAKVV